jgi:hypothetical protein
MFGAALSEFFEKKNEKKPETIVVNPTNTIIFFN